MKAARLGTILLLGTLAMSSSARAQGVPYSVPIRIPAGTHGMQPNLALVYSPSGGNGFLGMGWELAGLPAIGRTNYGTGINFAGADTYSHSQLGVLIAQTSTSYRTLKETFAQFIAYGTTCGDGPCYWIMTDRTGVKYWYGQTPSGATDSRLSAGPGIKIWALARVQDLQGNAYEVTYTALDSGLLYPSVITYTKGTGLTAYRTVEFTYQTQTRPDVESGYYSSLGFHWQSAHLLQRISVKSAGTVIRKYELAYGTATTGRSQLRSVQEYGTDTTSTCTGLGGTNNVCLPAQTFQWQSGSSTLAAQTFATNQGTWNTGAPPRLLTGDFDGDGRTDVMEFWNNPGSQIAFSFHPSSPANSPPQSWTPSPSRPALGDNASSLLAGDFNGDGKTDLAYVYNCNNNLCIDVFRSTGSGFVLQSSSGGQGPWVGGTNWKANGTFLTGDFNGDGKTDIAYVYQTSGLTLDVHLSTGSGFLYSWNVAGTSRTMGLSWQQSFVAGDFNGDGWADIVFIWFNAGRLMFDTYRFGGGSFSLKTTEDQGLWINPSQFLLGDFNGDGKTDIARLYGTPLSMTDPTLYTTVEAHLSTGTSFISQPWANDFGTWPTSSTKDGTFLRGDFNGDGKADIVYAHDPANGGTELDLDVHISTGSSLRFAYTTVLPGSWSGGSSWSSFMTFLQGDFNGDGKIDILRAWDASGSHEQYDLYAYDSAAPDLLTSIANGLGGTSTVAYTPAPQVANAIQPASTQPGIPNTSPQQLVTLVTTADGRGGSYSTSYRYQDSRVLAGHIADRRILGFHIVDVVDGGTGQFTRTTYRQEKYYEGLVAEVDDDVSTGQPMRSTTNSYQLANGTTCPVSPGAGTEYVCKLQTTVTTYEMGTSEYSTTTTNTYDAYGNITVRAIAPSGLPAVTVTTTYMSPDTNWILGQVTNVTTTSGSTQFSNATLHWTNNVVSSVDEYLDSKASWITTTLAHDGYGNLTSIQEPTTEDGLLRQSTVAYDDTFKAYPKTVTNAASEATTLTYFADGSLHTVTDPNGNVTTLGYDVFGRPLTANRPDGGQTTYSYNSYGLLSGPSLQNNQVVTTLSPTQSMTHQEFFDGMGFVYNITTTGDTENICVDNQKDSAGRLGQTSTPHKCSAGDVWTALGYDAAGRLASVTTPDGKVTTVGYSPATNRRCTTATDPNNHARTQCFNANEQAASSSQPDGSGVSYGYDPVGRLTSVTLANGAITQIAYDSHNRKTSLQQPETGTTTYAYFDNGTLKSVTTGNGTTTYSYDKANRVTLKKPGGDGQVTYNYSEAGVLNGIGRLTSLADDGGTTQFAYTSLGQLGRFTKTIDGSQFSQNFTYDFGGRTTQVTYPEGSHADYVYTAGSNLSTVALNGPVQATWSGYNALGQPGTLVFANNVTTTYGWDSMDHMTRLTSKFTPLKGGVTTTLQDLSFDWYTQTNGLLLHSITDNRGSPGSTSETQTYTYDIIDRLTQAVGVWGTKSYAYDASGHNIGDPTTFGGLVNRTLAYTGQQVTSGTGLSATYDAAGNMKHKVLDGVTWDYGWSVENRLLSATKNGTLAASMVYDAGGQRVKKVYSPASGPTVTTTYIGKMYEKRTYSDGSPQRHTVHVFGNGQQISSWTRSGTIMTAYEYQRGWRAEWMAAGLYDARTFTGAAKKLSHLFRAAVLHPVAPPALGFAVFAALAAVVLRSLRRAASAHSRRLRAVAASLALVFGLGACMSGDRGIGQLQEAVLSGDTTQGPPVGTFYYHPNHVNSSSVVSNAAGSEASRMVYLPFGELSQPNSAGSDVVTAKYTGQEDDEELGLYYYNARYYDPAIGRFLSADSIVPDPSDSQSFNRYSYVGNNPTMFTDPSGHDTDPCKPGSPLCIAFQQSQGDSQDSGGSGIAGHLAPPYNPPAESAPTRQPDPPPPPPQGLAPSTVVSSATDGLTPDGILRILYQNNGPDYWIKGWGFASHVRILEDSQGFTVNPIGVHGYLPSSFELVPFGEYRSVLRAAGVVPVNDDVNTAFVEAMEYLTGNIVMFGASGMASEALSGLIGGIGTPSMGVPQDLPALPQFTTSTVEEVVASTGRPRAGGQMTEGARAIAKKLGHADAGGYTSAFRGVAPTQANAESLVRGILSNPSSTTIGTRTIDVYNALGQGVRFDAVNKRFITFLEALLRTR